MSFKILDQVSMPAGAVNEDRVGALGDLAWVIDGATDVLDAPLTDAPTDSSWIAQHLDAALAAHARSPACEFEHLPQWLAADTAQAFSRVARRPPIARHEHPSAAALILQSLPGGIGFISVADCSLLIADADAVRRFGVKEDEAADVRLAGAIAAHSTSDHTANPNSLLQRMRPSLQRMRDHMNCVDGYGVLSITPPPRAFITSARAPVRPGARLLLASDGFMRLVDVFARHDTASLMREASARGLASPACELRAIEAADSDGAGHPRIKASDDASAILLELLA